MLRQVVRTKQCRAAVASTTRSSTSTILKRSIRTASSSNSYSKSHPGSKNWWRFIGAPLLIISGAAGGAIALSQPSILSSETKAEQQSRIDAASTRKLSDLTPIEYGSEEDFQNAFKEIELIIGKEHLSYSESDFDTHSDTYYQTHHPEPDQRPRLIVYPANTEQVSAIMKIVHKYRIPVVPFSGGTSLEGQFFQLRRGITIDLNRLDQIIQLNKEDGDITVQPAVGWQDLNEYLSPYGLLFGPDPGPGAEIGGMIGTSCSGTNAARYGTMKENVLGLTVVLADGTIIKTKKRPRKSAAGYNLTGLFIGSEGTLGIVTEATLKLHVKPEDETVAVVNFDTISDATNSVSEIVSRGIQVNAVEFLDANMMNCINFVGSTSKTWLEKPTLLIKVGGSKAIIGELIKEIKTITNNHKSINFEFASTAEEKEELWSARRMALWSTIDMGRKLIDPNVKVYITDVAVPISKLSTVITETQQDILKANLKATTIGHVGDGNFHALILYKEEDAQKTKELVERMVALALKNDGTCTGEHGVGVGKRNYLVQELGEDAVDVMRQVKLALDPLRLLNADKIFKIDPTDKGHH